MAKVNTVPQGLAGTGNATIFGANPVAAQFGNQLANLRQREYQDQLLAQQEAQRLAQRFRDNQLAASEGRLWAGEVGKLEQDHIQKGINLRQKGIDPYGVTPQALDYQKERRAVEAQQGYRKATESRFNELNKLISSDSDKYEPEDIQAVNDFFSNTKLGDAYANNLALPQLRERFKVNDYLKGTQAVTQEDVDINGNVRSDRKYIDKLATENALIGTLTRDPRGKTFLNKMTSGIPVNELRTFSPSFEENRARVESEITGNPDLMVRLAKEGIAPNTPKMKEFVENIAQTQTQAKRRFDNELAPLVAASAEGLSLYDKNTPYSDPNELTEYQKQSLALRRQSEARQQAKSNETAMNAATVRQDMVNRLVEGEEQAEDQLQAIIEGSLKLGGKKMGISKQGNTITYTIPKHLNQTGDLVPERVISIDKSVPAEKGKLNQFLNEVTGENISYSVFASEGGKKKVAGGLGVDELKKPASNALPRKGQEMKVQGGVAVFDGTKWRMK